MELLVYSRAAIERLPAHDVGHVIISISSAQDDVAKLPSSPCCRGVLRLFFADVAHPERHPELKAFSDADARAIWSFVLEHRASIERIVVHCDAGWSRSPAVAAALAKTLGQSDAEYFRRYHPNLHVYRTLLDGIAAMSHSGQ